MPHGLPGLLHADPRILPGARNCRGDGSYPKVTKKLARANVLVLDDLGLAPMTGQERRDLLEVIGDRNGMASHRHRRSVAHQKLA